MLCFGDWANGTNGTPDNTNLYVNVQQGELNLSRSTIAGSAAVYGITNVSPGATLYLLAAAATSVGGDGQILPSGSVLNMNGTMDLYYNNCTINTLTGTGTVTASATGHDFTAVLTLGASNGSCEFDGTILNGTAQTLFLGKTGTGILTLTNSANIYNGGTAIDGGTLQITNGHALGFGGTFLLNKSCAARRPAAAGWTWTDRR